MTSETKEKKVEKKTPMKQEEPKFSKQQLVRAKRYSMSEQSFLEVLLEDGKEYSLKDAETLLTKQLQRKVEK